MSTIACIVEGHGEVEAVPLLVRRLAAELRPGCVPTIRPVLRIPRSKLVKEGELERAVELAARKMEGPGAILVLLDAEDDCPALLGPQLLRRAATCRPDKNPAVVLAKREFESWFLAAAESLRGRRGLPQDLHAPEQPEEIRGAKEWLERHMPPHVRYSETLDQPAFAALFDLRSARRTDSFMKCCREVARLLAFEADTPG